MGTDTSKDKAEAIKSLYSQRDKLIREQSVSGQRKKQLTIY